MFSDILKSNKIVSDSRHFEDRSGFDMSGGGGEGGVIMVQTFYLFILHFRPFSTVWRGLGKSFFFWQMG